MATETPYRLRGVARSHPDPYQVSKGLFNHRSFRAIRGQGVELEVISPRPHAPPIGPYSDLRRIPKRVEEEYPVHYPRFVYLLPKRLFKYTTNSWSFNRTVSRTLQRQPDPDIFHAGHIYFDGYALAEYTQDRDQAFTVMGHGTILNEYENSSSKVRSIVRSVLDGAARVFCVSESLVEIARSITDPEKVHLVPIGADPDRFPVESKTVLRAQHSIPDSEPLVLFVGRCSPQKGIGDIIRLLPSIRKLNGTLAVISQGGEMRETLLEAIERENMGDSTRLLWNVEPDTVAEWFAMADLLVLPSRSEGRPTVIYEAMASRTPVLAYDVGGVGEQIDDGRTGVLNPDGEFSQYKTKLNTLLSDVDALEKMGKKGQERLVEKGWIWSNHAQTIVNHHQEIISE